MTTVTQPISSSDPERGRKERERAFHNDRFSQGPEEWVPASYSLIESSSSFFEREIVRRSEGGTVLEYGCGPGTYSFELAEKAARVIGVDISEVAIERARTRAERMRLTDKTEFHVMDCEALTFPEATFDLVCGRAILHHLDLAKALSTIARVLKPNGAAAFYEPLGHNPVVNLYRRMTPAIRTADEHPLVMRDLAQARDLFERVQFVPFVLFSMLATPLRKSRLFPHALKLLENVDAAAFKVPGLGKYAWTSVWIMEGPRSEGRR
jgi:SAM-dependent methyltransferase